MAKIELPKVFTKKHRAYKPELKHLLGKYYTSYSDISSFNEYFGDFVKQTLAGIKLPSSIYAEFGNFIGTAVETGEIPKENPHKFEGLENIQLIDRPENTTYERMIIIDFGEWFLMGFIDKCTEIRPKVVDIIDIKTGGSKKEKYYEGPDYIQVPLYAYAMEQEGYTINKTAVEFCRRVGSHVNPPLKLSEEMFEIPLEYSPERAKFALDKVQSTVEKISEYYKIYNKYFKK